MIAASTLASVSCCSSRVYDLSNRGNSSEVFCQRAMKSDFRPDSCASKVVVSTCGLWGRAAIDSAFGIFGICFCAGDRHVAGVFVCVRGEERKVAGNERRNNCQWSMTNCQLIMKLTSILGKEHDEDPRQEPRDRRGDSRMINDDLTIVNSSFTIDHENRACA